MITVDVPVTLSERVNAPVTVNYGAIEPEGTASWLEDFDPVLSTMTFLPGKTALSLKIKGDTLDEADESALVQFAGAVNAHVGGFGVGAVAIVDDDP